MKPARAIQMLANVRRSHGWREAVRIGWCGLRNRGETRIFLFVLSDPRPVPKAVVAARSHTFRFASKQDLERLACDPINEVVHSDIERLDEGVKCLLQLDGDHVVGYAWIWGSQLPYIAEGVHLNIPDDTIYNYKGYTAAQYRGHGFQALRHLKLLELLQSEGKRRLFGFVDQFNSNSLRGVRKSGYKLVGELRIRRRRGDVVVHLKLATEFWCDVARL